MATTDQWHDRARDAERKLREIAKLRQVFALRDGAVR